MNIFLFCIALNKDKNPLDKLNVPNFLPCKIINSNILKELLHNQDWVNFLNQIWHPQISRHSFFQPVVVTMEWKKN